jgi:GNAT superfamily N-acetyltransferase
MDNISFVRLNYENFDSFKNIIEESEKIYPEELRTEINDYKEMVFEDNSIALLAYLDNKYIGNIIGCQSFEIELNNFKLSESKTKAIYIYNLLIVPEFQGKGYGKLLMQRFINIATKLNYNFIAGNFRKNGSYKIAKSFNPILEKITLNWEDSGEDFVYCLLKI